MTAMKVFDGLRVVEVAQYVYVPAAGAVLSDLGADVIKIEHPVTGDKYRGVHTATLGSAGTPVNVRWEHPNRGKRSLGLDLRSEDGRNVLLQLVEKADVFLTNFRPGALQRLRLDVPDLRARIQRLFMHVGLDSGSGVRE